MDPVHQFYERFQFFQIARVIRDDRKDIRMLSRIHDSGIGRSPDPLRDPSSFGLRFVRFPQHRLYGRTVRSLKKFSDLFSVCGIHCNILIIQQPQSGQILCRKAGIIPLCQRCFRPDCLTPGIIISSAVHPDQTAV